MIVRWILLPLRISIGWFGHHGERDSELNVELKTLVFVNKMHYAKS
jgi:hypothetical protein